MNEYIVSSAEMLKDTPSIAGAVPKWRLGNKYIKLSTSINGYESYSEVIVSKLGSLLGFNVCEYKLCIVNVDNQKKYIGCESTDFNKYNYELVDFVQLGLQGYFSVTELNSKEIYSWLCSIKKEKYLEEALMLVYLTLDTDRHLGNLALFQNTNTMELELAPLFDFGAALLSTKTVPTRYTEKITKILKCKPFSIDWDRQLSLLADKLPVIVDYRKEIAQFVRELPKELSEERKRFIIELLNARYEDYMKLRKSLID
jgi:hypothetical protein